MAIEDWIIRDGIPVTTVARTLLDLAEVLTISQMRRCLGEAVRLRLVTIDEMWRLYDRSRGRHGLRPLRALLTEYSPPPRLRSRFERRVRRLIRGTEIREPEFNAIVAGHEVDVLWRRERLIVELDTYTYHGTPGDFERDRAKDADLMLAGYRVLRITGERVTHEPAQILATIETLLDSTPYVA